MCFGDIFVFNYSYLLIQEESRSFEDVFNWWFGKEKVDEEGEVVVVVVEVVVVVRKGSTGWTVHLGKVVNKLYNLSPGQRVFEVCRWPINW